MSLNRYDQLLHAIDLFKPQSIVEIGTWNGRNAVRMIQQAQKHRENIQYIGYDLFEDANDKTDVDEFNVKKHNSVIEIDSFIRKHCPLAEICLVKGNTRDTLRHIEADFVYIDGGHSIETIRSDYEAVKGSRVVILDDYYLADSAGNRPDINSMGANQIAEKIGAYLLPVGGKLKEQGGLVLMALRVNR